MPVGVTSGVETEKIPPAGSGLVELSLRSRSKSSLSGVVSLQPTERSDASSCERAKEARLQVKNWSKYNESLVSRSDITVWFYDEVIDAWEPENAEKRVGHPFANSDLVIEILRWDHLLSVRCPFNCRQWRRPQRLGGHFDRGKIALVVTLLRGAIRGRRGRSKPPSAISVSVNSDLRQTCGGFIVRRSFGWPQKLRSVDITSFSSAPVNLPRLDHHQRVWAVAKSLKWLFGEGASAACLESSPCSALGLSSRGKPPGRSIGGGFAWIFLRSAYASGHAVSSPGFAPT